MRSRLSALRLAALSNVAERLLRACTSLDYGNYEVIVVDDSTDHTTDIVRRWSSHPRMKVIHRTTRKGYKPGALQEALKHMSPQAQYVCPPDFEKVLVRMDGKTRLASMGESVESELKYSKEPMVVNGVTWIKPNRCIEVVSFDRKTLKVSFCPVSRMLSRQGNGRILKIETEDGRIVHVSTDHPMLVAGEDGFYVYNVTVLDT